MKNVFPITYTPFHKCTPFKPKGSARQADFQAMADINDSKTIAYPPQPISINQMPAMRAVGANCCSVRAEQERLCGLIAPTQPDIITLQEIWDFQYLQSIKNLPYRCTTAKDFHRGGLATLLARCRQ